DGIRDRNVTGVQTCALPIYQFGDLYSLLCNEVWLRVAVHHVQQNKGSETAGIDGKNMSNFLGNFDGYIEELTTTLKAETFEPCQIGRASCRERVNMTEVERA